MTNALPPYSAYRDSGVTWLGEIPAHWEASTVGRHFSVELGKMLNRATEDGTGIVKPYVRAANVHWSGVELDSAGVNEMEFSPRQLERYRLRPGDLLVTEGGVTVGRSAFWRGELEECYYQNSLNRARALPGSPLSAKYLYYWMYFTTQNGYVDLVADKATFQHLTNKMLLAFPIVVPGASEQRAIAVFLDRETARLDALIGKKERLLALLSEKRAALISHAVTKGLDPSVPMRDSGIAWLGEIPAHWEVKRLKFLASRLTAGPFGSSLTKDLYTQGGYRVYGQEQVIPGDFTVGDYYIAEGLYRLMSQYAVAPGDVLISCVGTFGKVAVVPLDAEPGVINPRLIKVTPDRGLIVPEYLEVVLRSGVSYGQFEQASRGGTMGVINLGLISEILIPVPPLSEQRVILEESDSTTRRLDSLLAKVRAAIDTLREYRAALISAAVTGKIDVRGEV
jgi:type I restriction enzyme, S subunit